MDPRDNKFLLDLTEIIEEQLTNDRFGVTELASAAAMSRSNLLRRIKKASGLSASQFIRQVRLERAMELLGESALTVSEVSYRVGFSSTSYFIKCFHEHYGYPPGEILKHPGGASAETVAGKSQRRHQLAAIMFTDIEGYTALMQRDETQAVVFRDRHREVFNAAVKKYRGRILQYYGDGTLSTFSSAIDAVRCGTEMQLAFSEEPKIPVRVGIHSGDIIFTEDDIIGDGVNVASRIESLAVTGSVFISGKVYDEVKNQAGIRTEPMGIFELKNVEQPIQVYAVSTPGLVVPERVHMAGKLKDSADRRHKTGQSGFQKSTLFWILVPALFVIAALLLYFTGILDYNSTGSPDQDPEITQKSIAVLPFINDSDDSSNIYMVNGLMESILNNLQKIGELRVISRTSVEKYRNRPKLIPEIARELNVKYLVEGSGQKIGDQIKLSIQLIDAPNDRHLWSEQYSRGTEDIFTLQGEIAQRIAEQIKVFITPEEQERIKKVLTENMKAYDYYLQALHYMFSLEDANQKKAIELFHEAAAEDDNFAAAWANIALAYYNLDRYRSEKIYADSIDKYADKALLLDPQLAQSLIAKAYSHINAASWEEAVPYLQKALEYNPNSSLVFNILMDFYANHYPDTEKYLEYALKAIRLDIASRDSVSASFIYLHVSNAFIQSGFVDEAQEYINKSLSLYPENTYSLHLKAYIRYAVTRDLERLKESLLEVFQMDTTRLDLLQEIAKTCYYLRDYECAFTYYDRVCKVRRDNGLDIFRGEDAKIGFVFAKMGRIGESEQLFNAYRQYAENDETVYKHLSLAVYHDHLGNTEEALDHFEAFADQQNHSYWIVLFLEMDPLMEKLINLPEGRKILDKIKRDFKKHHQEVRSALVDEGLV